MILTKRKKKKKSIRRSGAISEEFSWDVDFNTPFEKIETLREKMMLFLHHERRDFVPAIDISVKGWVFLFFFLHISCLLSLLIWGAVFFMVFHRF